MHLLIINTSAVRQENDCATSRLFKGTVLNAKPHKRI